MLRNRRQRFHRGEPGTLRALRFNDAALWAQRWAGSKGGTQTTDGNEAGDGGRLMQKSPQLASC